MIALNRFLLFMALVALFVSSDVAAQKAPETGIDTGNFDVTVRPQDDFFRYVNGTWLRKTEIPLDRSTFGSFYELRDRSEAALKEIVEDLDALPSRKQGSDEQRIVDLYRSFMDTVQIEAAGIKPLEPVLGTIRTSTDPVETFLAMQFAGVATPFSVYVGQDPRQADRYIVTVSQSGLGLPDRDYYFREGDVFDRYRAAYLTYAETLFRLAGTAQPAESARDVVAFEKQLAACHWDRARNRDRELTYNFRSVSELSAAMPHFGWATYLNGLGGGATPGVVVRQPDYLAFVDSLLAATPPETFRRYLTLRVLDAYAPVLPQAFASASFEFRDRVLSGQEVERPRWKRGIGTVERALGEAVGRIYVERHFQPEHKQRMQHLVDNLVAAFRESIDQLEWMGPETRTQAQEKLARFNVKIGYPDRWRDYSRLTIDPTDLVGNLMRTQRFDIERRFDRLGKEIDRLEWGMTPQTVNAYYSSTMNEIVFPAAILQPPFFNPDADDAVNYGAIGGVIGHEISHGFDDQGRRSDGSGNLRDWWTEQDNEAFKARADRLVAQYNGFSPVDGLQVNGRLTLGENIGDLSGLTVAYRAYRRSLDGGESPVVDGFTGDQRFFLGWGQIWRRKDRDEALRQQVLTDPHSPAEFRVNGTLRNMPEFYAAFGVKPGDAMYLEPDQRVKIW